MMRFAVRALGRTGCPASNRYSNGRSNAQRMERALRPRPRIRLNTARPSSSQTIASPSTTQQRTGSAATAAEVCGKWSAKSWPDAASRGR